MATNLIKPASFDIDNKLIDLSNIDDFDWKKVMAIYNYTTNGWIFKFSKIPYINNLGNGIIHFNAPTEGMDNTDEIGVFYLTISTGGSGGNATAPIDSIDLSWMQ